MTNHEFASDKVKQEGGNGVPPTAKPVGIPPKIL